MKHRVTGGFSLLLGSKACDKLKKNKDINTYILKKEYKYLEMVNMPVLI